MTVPAEQPGRPALKTDHPVMLTMPAAALQRQGQPAGVVSRLLANSIDFLVVLLFLGAVYLGICGWRLLSNPSGFTFPSAPRGTVLILAGAFSMLYLTLCWWLAGRTYGDRLMALKVRNFRKQRLLFPGAVARAALCLIFPIGVLWCAVNSSNRSVQDVILRTSVIYDWHD
jgi:uncharacterized RDD family membrane protein YckC